MNNTTPSTQTNVEVPPPPRTNPAPEPVNPVAGKQNDPGRLQDEAHGDSDAATRGTSASNDQDIGNDPVEQVSPQAGKDVEGW